MMNRLDKYYEPHPQQLLRRSHRALLMLPPPPLVESGSGCAGSGTSRHSTWSSRGGTATANGSSSSGGGGGGGGGGGQGFAALERGERIRPERGARRSHVQKMQWRASRWVSGFPRAPPGEGEDDDGDQFDTRVSSMTIADVSPRFAVKRILFLYENLQFREAANFINRLSHGTFKVILGDLPVDLFVESMPHSLSILEALYAKVFLSDGLDFSVKLLRPEGVVMQMVKFFSTQNAGVAGERDWEPAAPFVSSCKKLLKVIVLSDPKLKKLLQQRRRRLDKAIEGLGQHGLVGTTDETLTDLHDALRLEFQRVVETYKGALQKLEELSLGGAVAAGGVAHGPAPVRASHQRQLSLRQPDIQERLIKNQTLLNVVEPARASCSLDILLGILQRRVDGDKEALFQFTQLRKEAGGQVAPDSVVAPVLMRFSHGCDQVLELMKEVAEDEDDSSDISGYHSDSDSAIMMSGNSPYVSKRARYNFLTRSVRSSNKSSARTSVLLSQQLSSSSGASSDQHSDPGAPAGPPSPPGSLGSAPAATPDDALKPRQLKLKKELHKLNSAGSSTTCGGSATTAAVALPCCQGCQPRASLQVLPPGCDRESAALRAEMESLRAELSRSNTRVQVLLESERQLKDRLASVASVPVSPCGGALSGGERLVRCYANLYTSARVDALDALDNLTPLKDADELKSKILFSVVVLAFRAAQSLLLLKKDHVRRVLHIPPPAQNSPGSPVQPKIPTDTAVAELEISVATYLRRTVDNFELSKSVEEVLSQIWATLYDYPCLKNCPGLVQYVKDAVRLAWSLVNQTPPYVLEYEQRMLRKDVHVRFHASNPENDQIRTYLWPALLEGTGGPCVHKAVVIT